MDGSVIGGILIPFIGTASGAACVLFLKKEMGRTAQRALLGFAAGVMTAASVWSLLIPAIEQAHKLNVPYSLPVAAGFWAGILFLLFLDAAAPQTPSMRMQSPGADRTMLLVFAVTLHNIPEGMAVGAVYAGYLAGNMEIGMMGALALSLGIALQNFPEGAIVSMPLGAEGMEKKKAFLYGALSGAVEPAAAALTILLARFLLPTLPYMLSFAAGAMIFVVVEDLIPDMMEGRQSSLGTILFAAGFSVMMMLDVMMG